MAARCPVVVVGAGVGGLAAALDLAGRGMDVTVLEGATAPGGKLREVAVAGARLDAGPTVFTMRWVFEELFAAAGTNLAARLALQPVEVLARHAWSGHERLDLYADPERSVEAIGAFAGATEGRRYREFCRRARSIYRTLERPFIRAARPGPLGLVRGVGLRGLGDLWRISPFATLWRALGEHFHDPRLRQLFGRYATYCGSSPFLAPATLMLVAHVEQDGVWLVQGGMHRVAAALEALAAERGAVFCYGAEVAAVDAADGRVTGVTLASGEHLPARAVVVNADLSAVADGHFGADAARSVPPVPRAARSLSAVTWNVVARTAGFPLLRHTVFFSGDYAAEFDAIFRHGRLPGTPTVYVCAQDRDDRESTTPAGPERLLCLVNAPASGDAGGPDADDLARCEAAAFGLLARCGLEIERHPERILRTTPRDFHRLFPATGGALYGRAFHGWRASFARPGSRTRLPGLYLAGGSVHPGPGVPMAAISGRLAAACVLADLGA
ncbi:MAG: 1-hydroxycarotenoid 3,4-desaturase CrtD [Pseudomonadota bacterium]